ncbi:30S ribosomal protein S2 [Candidatus Falkowbacteria bacterium HGW-Falkowbacteria-1]|uniref:Small ribosomal subunit protein uS2 n=1 Tax=Candidatus Falkowbacteria bacterium HGW-Falkowbacteria-1 TaxID=2013768 RepID=A0A2N2E9N3_9BACT|nr:MAG: 30S ribosomal protein S2 [Candidatus Falkowbacteria bacterium HGW-Falkowbacteria-1]
MNIPKLEEMLKAGMHFGHRTNRWHPKMEPFIFTKKNGIYIINIEKTQEQIKKALEFMIKLRNEDKIILFVGTKKQVKASMKKMAEEIKSPYIVGKWLGGLVTNFAVIKKSIKKYQDLLNDKESGKLGKYTKKEQLDFDRETKRLEERVGGLVGLTRLPDAIFIWDLKEEKTAVAEAISKNIPIIAVCDTNVNPELADYPIPANDDATKTVELLLNCIKDNLLNAKNIQLK